MTAEHESTGVVIIGAGPAGLLLGHMLGQAGVPFVILEQRSREHVLSRIRAGVLEQASVDVLSTHGLATRLRERGLTHDGIYLQFEGERHRVSFRELLGRTVTVYGQQALVLDLTEEHERIGSPLLFGVPDVQLRGVEGSSPSVSFTHDGAHHETSCDFVVGADGYHGVARAAVPASKLSAVERTYDFAWLGVLADVSPSTDELIYSLHPDGFAMHSMRSADVSRFYLQVHPEEQLGDWSDARVWDRLQTRLGHANWTLHEGPITEKSITPMRSFVVSTLAHGRLFLVGDAGHIVPPTGAKGLNAAIADVAMLGRAIIEHRSGNDAGLEQYSERALRRQWKVQQFSQWMTDMLHIRSDTAEPSANEFRYRSQVGQLRYTVESPHALRSLAEQYVGLPI